VNLGTDVLDCLRHRDTAYRTKGDPDRPTYGPQRAADRRTGHVASALDQLGG
jgi:hypothetical protein